MDNEEVILTQEGFDKLEQQLEYLKTTERTENRRKNQDSIRIWRFI